MVVIRGSSPASVYILSTSLAMRKNVTGYDEDGEQQKGSPADTVTPIVLELLTVPIRPDPRPEPERHDSHENRESN